MARRQPGDRPPPRRLAARPLTPSSSLAPQDAEKEDFEEKLKEVQDVCSPIISKVYRESGGAPGGGGDFGADDDLDGHDEL